MALSFEYKYLKWGYGPHNGPSTWPDQYPAAKSQQSPVDIKTESTVAAPQIAPIRAQYRPCQLLNLENTGVSWQLHFHDPTIASLTGGALQAEYQIVQMHAHWGSRDGLGSEHTIDGQAYDAELHIVHFNTKYSSPGEAFDKPDGLAVLGMLVTVGDHHKEFQKIVERFSEIENPKEVIQLETTIDAGEFLPKDRTFFTYPGSLTTPPLYESVTWSLFREPIQVSRHQLEAMRSLKTGSGRQKTSLVNNYRPPCCLEGRRVSLCCS